MATDKDKGYVGLLQPGTVIGDSYRVEAFLGKGGMGEVWVARHLRLANRRVAIKVLRTQGESLPEESLVRFRKEAEIASRLEHPHIVNIYDYNFTPSGYPFMVMEFLEGESLGAKLKKEGPFSLADTRTVIRQVCRALEATHSQDILHRDLKPDNIFLTTQGTELWVKVLDFGISKILNANNTQFTQESIIIGSPRYVSPEQARGLNSRLTPQADIFSLGAVAYEMLTGKPAFGGDDVSQVLFRVVYESPKPLDELLPSLPSGARHAIEMAMAKQPEKRHASAMAFSEAFDKDTWVPTLSYGVTPEAPKTPAHEELTQSVRAPLQKHPWLLMVLVGMLAAAIVGGAVFYRQYTRKVPATFTPPPPPKTEVLRPKPPVEEVVVKPKPPVEEEVVKPKPPVEEEGVKPKPPAEEEVVKPKPLPPPPTPPKTGSKTPGKTPQPPKPAPPPRPPPVAVSEPLPSLNAEEQRILARAEKALQAKQYNEAEVFARRSLTSLERNGAGWARAYAIVAEVACAQKDASKYNAAYAALPAAWKASVKATCKRLGFEP